MPIKTIFSCFYILLIPMLMTAQQSNNSGLQYFTNTKLVNQWGEEMRYYDDLLKGKTVVIHGFIAECSTSCPIIFNTLQTIQNKYSHQIGKNLHLISITVNPNQDRLSSISELSEKYGAKQGWYFLTGSVENVNFVTKKMGKYVKNPHEHDNILIIGNEATGLWKKAFGFSSADNIIEVLNSVLNDKG